MALDTTRCPLCGQPNYCAMTSGQDKKICWCSEVKIPLALLDQLPLKAKGRACVCKICIDEFNIKN